jgi:quinol monooxygenase YgiN
MRLITIEYTVRADVSLDEVKAHISAFVAGIHRQHAGHRYTSCQRPAEPRRFVHFAEIVESEAAALQAEPFFGEFTAYLRAHCEAPPLVTTLAKVASTVDL